MRGAAGAPQDSIDGGRTMTMPMAAGSGSGPNYDIPQGFVGSSPAFLLMLSELRRMADSDAPVLIEGETGAGKELAARAIHYRGTRRDGPFIVVNCGALPDHLLEAELFGHERGAFTDAKTARRGLVAEANTGSLFLDEVDSLSAKAQVALMRFLQDHRYRPVGSARELYTDVRVIAATNRSLQAAAAQAHFRTDLLYRLNILRLVLPALRERQGDIEQLARHFAALYCAKYRLAPREFDGATLGWMKSYAWPGNVRELENWVHRALLMSEGSLIRVESCPAQARRPANEPVSSFHRAKAEAVRLFEYEYVVTVLRKTGGNVTRAARMAGKERRAFGKLLKKHGIDRELLSE